MTNQNVMLSESKPTIGVKITLTLSNSSLFSQPSTAGYITISRKKVSKKLDNEGGPKVNAWVDSMRDSSPTRVKSTASLSETEEKSSWIAHHPSALSKFEEIVNASKGKKIVMFLDYDGTLAPIVEDPDRAFMTKEMREAVKDVARYFPTAIVTGRCRDKVFSFVKLAGLYYAGSHGMDIEGPSKSRKYKKGNQGVLFQPASEFLPMIDESSLSIIHSPFSTDYTLRQSPFSTFYTLLQSAISTPQVYKTLLEKTKSIPGAKVENNKFCLSVHFRRVDEKSWGALVEEVRLVLNEYPKLKLTQGRKVLEIRPTIKWDKGRALEFLLEALGYANSKDVVPVYIGDDRTDEDAFKVLRNREQGFGILVSKVPKDTNASYSLQEPSEVNEFLRRLVDWKRSSLRQQ